MGWNPLTREQAEERVTAWITDRLPALDASAQTIAGWLSWEASDLAFLVDVDWPDAVRTDLPATVTAPRFDLPAEQRSERNVVDAEVPVDALRLLVDIHTGEIAAAERSEPVDHQLELWRRAKSLDEDGPPGSVPPAAPDQPA